MANILDEQWLAVTRKDGAQIVDKDTGTTLLSVPADYITEALKEELSKTGVLRAKVAALAPMMAKALLGYAHLRDDGGPTGISWALEREEAVLKAARAVRALVEKVEA